MPSCVANDCSNKTSGKGRDKTLSFHKFPFHDKDLLARWIVNTARDNWQPTKTVSTLCSKHFEPSCFEEDLYDKYVGRSPGKKPRRKLKSGAVPTIFSHKADTTKPRTHTEARVKRQERQEVSGSVMTVLWQHLVSVRQECFYSPQVYPE